MVIHTSNNSALETEPGYEIKASLGSEQKAAAQNYPSGLRIHLSQYSVCLAFWVYPLACIKLGVEAHSGEVAGDASQKFKT